MHTRAYRRYKNYTKQKRKIDIFKRKFGYIRDYSDSVSKSQIGQLVKGKPYCSCYMCNGADKWNNGIWCVRKQKANEKLKLDFKDYDEGGCLYEDDCNVQCQENHERTSNAIEFLDGNIRGFTKEESKNYEKALSKIYKPIHVDIINKGDE